MFLGQTDEHCCSSHRMQLLAVDILVVNVGGRVLEENPRVFEKEFAQNYGEMIGNINRYVNAFKDNEIVFTQSQRAKYLMLYVAFARWVFVCYPLLYIHCCLRMEQWLPLEECQGPTIYCGQRDIRPTLHAAIYLASVEDKAMVG